jgi:hypothetical protein
MKIDRSLRRVTRFFRDLHAYWRLFTGDGKHGQYVVSRVADDDYKTLKQAKELHAQTYLYRGFVDRSDVKKGIIHEKSDPHQLHADYFVVKNRGKVVAVARQITYKGDGDHRASFPTLDQAVIYNRSRVHLSKIDPRHIVEISALVKKRGESQMVPLMLYRELWRHSLGKHKVWVMACDVRLYERLKIVAGPAVRHIGRRSSYKGGDVMPVMLEPHTALGVFMKRAHTRVPFRRVMNRYILKFFVQDCPPQALTSIDARRLEQALAHRSVNFFGKWELLWIVLVFGYSVARSLLVAATLRQYGINPYVFFIIDVGTATLYASAQVMALRALRERHLVKFAAWLGVVLVWFVAPYGYLMLSGRSMPVYVYAVIGVWFLLFAVIAVYNFLRRTRQP